MVAQADAKPDHFKLAERQGTFDRIDSKFRSSISSEPGARFPPEKDRYVRTQPQDPRPYMIRKPRYINIPLHQVLYITLVCPFAHRANIVRSLKGLEETIQLVIMDYELYPHGWSFTGRAGTAIQDPIYGFKRFSELYLKADAEYKGRYSVPVLWDKKLETIVNNESADIMRMLYSGFDSLLAPAKREGERASGGLYPEGLRGEIDAMNGWVNPVLNTGVYKAGFATEQGSYEKACVEVFEGLGRVEEILANRKGPYLFGEHVTEADVRLYPTVVRFDIAYYTLFKCNLKMIRHDYPGIQRWLVNLYGQKGFGDTTNFEHVSIFFEMVQESLVTIPR